MVTRTAVFQQSGLGRFSNRSTLCAITTGLDEPCHQSGVAKIARSC
jgi:hypothetical protein